MTTASILWGLLFGTIGAAMALYGRRQAAPVPLLAGLGLIVFPMFITNSIALVCTGIALVALPYFVRI